MKNEVTIKGELFWCKWMKSFNKVFTEDNNRYECTVGNISAEDCKKLESLGIKIKHKDSQGNFIVGKTMDHAFYNLQDTSGKPIDSDTFGNGTKATVTLTSYENKMTKMHGRGPSINKIIVTEVITYNPSPIDSITEDVL